MTRQETVIKITKITRIVGEMKSQLDLDDEIEFEALDSSWMNIGKWAEEICQYIKQVNQYRFIYEGNSVYRRYSNDHCCS